MFILIIYWNLKIGDIMICWKIEKNGFKKSFVDFVDFLFILII